MEVRDKGLLGTSVSLREPQRVSKSLRELYKFSEILRESQGFSEPFRNSQETQKTSETSGILSETRTLREP